MESDEYTCTLKETWQKKARDELNEDEVERLPSVQALREWIHQQKWLKTPTDTQFLLRFLRVRKFSQLGARTTLENYWRARTKTPEWFANVSPDDPAILEIIRSGFYIFTKEEDKYGRRLIIERPGVLKMEEIKKKYGLAKVFQAIMCVWDILALDERIQVNGFVLLHDGGLSDSDTALAYNMTNMRKCFHIFQKAYPTRIKGLHTYRMPVMFEALLKFCKALLSDKLSNRLIIHGKSMVPVYDYIDQTHLPREYLPDNYDGQCAGTIQEIVEYMVKEFTKPEVVAHVNDLNSGKYGVDREVRAQLDVPQTSYRKLSL